MVRFLGIMVGLGMVASLAWSFIWGAGAFIAEPPEASLESRFHQHPKHVSFASDGPFGRYDKQQLQRGLQVYKEVCAACHSLRLVTFRDLEGLGYNEPEIKAFAKQFDVPDLNPDTGEPSTRKGIAADRFPSPFANEIAARAANNNALPPDLSLIVKARHGGAPYIFSLLTGYQDPPKDLPAESRPGEGLHYNPYFANLNIAMTPPLSADGQVTYADGTVATREQMAKDVAAFLTWTAEPKADARKDAGLAVLIFLLFATVLAYLAYRNVWADMKKRKVAATEPLDPENAAKREAAGREAGISD